MNNTFSFYRLKLLFQKDWAENKKIYFLAIPAIIILITTLFVLMDFDNKLLYATKFKNLSWWGFLQEVFYTIGLLMTGIVAAGFRFVSFDNKKQGTGFLLLPSSATEKMVLNWIWALPVPLITYTILFHLVEYPFINSFIEKAKQANMYQNAIGLEHLNLIHCIKNNLEKLGCGLIFISTTLISSFLFKKYSFIKTIILLAASMFLLVKLQEFTLQQFFPGVPKVSGSYFDVVINSCNVGSSQINLTHQQHLWIGSILFVLVTMLIWLTNWYKIKEKQL